MSYIRSIPSTLEETFHHFITSFTKLPIFTLQNLVIIGTDYTCICKSNYHANSMEIDMTINVQTQIYIASNANTTTDFVKSLLKNIYAEDGKLHIQQ